MKFMPFDSLFSVLEVWFPFRSDWTKKSMAGRFDPLENYGVTVAPSIGASYVSIRFKEQER